MMIKLSTRDDDSDDEETFSHSSKKGENFTSLQDTKEQQRSQFAMVKNERSIVVDCALLELARRAHDAGGGGKRESNEQSFLSSSNQVYLHKIHIDSNFHSL